MSPGTNGSAQAPDIRKVCAGCGQSKPVAAFYKDKKLPDGFYRRCKDCHGLACKAWAARNPAKVKALNTAYRERHRAKRKARDDVKVAVECGRLTKPRDCQRCGVKPGPRDLHGHHQDYSKSLDVEWLCRPCHFIRHEEEKVSANAM